MEIIILPINLMLLAALVVFCGGVVPRRHQNWTTVCGFSIGMPAFVIIGSGLLGLLFG